MALTSPHQELELHQATQGLPALAPNLHPWLVPLPPELVPSPATQALSASPSSKKNTLLQDRVTHILQNPVTQVSYLRFSQPPQAFTIYFSVATEALFSHSCYFFFFPSFYYHIMSSCLLVFFLVILAVLAHCVYQKKNSRWFIEINLNL